MAAMSSMFNPTRSRRFHPTSRSHLLISRRPACESTKMAYLRMEAPGLLPMQVSFKIQLNWNGLTRGSYHMTTNRNSRFHLTAELPGTYWDSVRIVRDDR